MMRSIAGTGSLGMVVVVACIGGACSSGSGPSGARPGSGQTGSSSGGSASSSGGVGSGSGGSASRSGSGGATLPLVTPLVKAATPTGLDGSGPAPAHTKAFAGGFQFEAQFLADGGDAPLSGDMCPGSGGGVCPDGGVSGGPGGDGGMNGGPDGPGGDGGGAPPSGEMCPGSGGVCSDGGMNGGPGGPGGDGGGAPPSGDMCPGGGGGVCPDGGMNGGPGGDGGTPPASGAGLDPADIRSRFFLAGPTNIFSILAELDGRIDEVNQRSANGDVPCLSATPVPYALTPFGRSVPFYAQCAAQLVGPMQTGGFFEFGVNAGVIYLYEAIGAEAIGARLTPAVSGAGGYTVEAWMGVGYNNTTGCGNRNGFDDCSYGVMAIEADAQRTHLELSVAGIGFGYCGAQLASDGATVYVAGSVDMGATCGAAATACVSATDLTAIVPCAAISFDLPAIGRAATSGPNGAWGASASGSSGIVLDGTASDALAFGPSMPAAGVGSFATEARNADGGSIDGGGNAMPGNARADGGTD
jgi:hypothetical protein